MTEVPEQTRMTPSGQSASLVALAESEQRSRTLVEALPDAIFVLSENKIVFVNPFCVRLLLAEGPEQLLGKGISEIIHSNDQPTISNRIRDCCSTGTASPPMEAVLIACDGRSVEIEVVAIPISWNGSPAIEVVARDISKRKRAEQAAHDWQKRLELAQKAGLRIGLWDWDVMANTVTWSDETYRQFGLTHDTFSGRLGDAVARIHPDDRPRVEDAIRKLLAGGAEYAAAYRLVRPDGSTRWIDAHGVMVHSGSAHMLGVGVDITDLKKTEQSLQDSQEKHLLLLNSTAEAIYGLDLIGNCTFCNPACLRLLRYETPEDLLGKRMHSVLHHTRADGTPYPEEQCQIYVAVREGRASHITDEVLWRADGTSFSAEYWSYPMYKAGKPVGAVVTFLDISHRKRTEEALRESEEKYRELFENATYGIFRSTPSGALLDVNPALVTMLGYGSKEELLTRNLTYDIYEDPAARRSMLERCEPSGRVDGAEVNWKRNDGTSIPVRLSGGMVRGENGLVCHNEVFVEDITERRCLEREKLLLLDQERLAQADAESAKSELLQALSRISDGFLVLDGKWRCRYINEQGARYIECRPEDLVGKHIWTEFPESADQSPYYLYRKALDQNISISEEVYFAQWKRWFDVRIYPSADGLSILLHDITDRQQTQQELRDTLEQLRALSDRLQKAREEERKRVARDLHDQIGQILTAVKMDVDWVTKRLPQNQAQLRARLGTALDLVRDATKSLRAICTELRPGVLDDLGLGAAIEWQANEFASRTGIRCEVTVPTEDPPLDADCSTAIFRIFQEALANVARHAEAKAVRGSLTHRDGRIWLMVRDDGKGILDSDVAASKGSLGLLGMKERAQGCGGELQIWGEPGRGTTVSADIPLSDSKQKETSNHAHCVSR